MLRRRSDSRRRLLCLGIALLILGVGNVPWPRADFHNIRHHDGPGESCPLHDHLLGSHPEAGRAEDVAVLHWHWVPPHCPTPVDDPAAMHALTQDWPAAEGAGSLILVPPEPSGWLEAETGPMTDAVASLFEPCPIRPPGPRLDAGALRASASLLDGPPPLTILLGRWTC